MQQSVGVEGVKSGAIALKLSLTRRRCRAVGQPRGQPVGVHPGEELLVEAVDVADGLLQDVGLEQKRGGQTDWGLILLSAVRCL